MGLRSINYGKYKTFAPRYQPSALPWADIEGQKSFICHKDLEPILYCVAYSH